MTQQEQLTRWRLILGSETQQSFEGMGGVPLAREAQAIQAACGRRLLANFSPEDEAQFRRLLETVLENGAHLMEKEVQP